MTPLRELLLERLREKGPITFAQYMTEALYHPELGYYAAGPARSGWDGDFVTSAALHPAFAELWGRFFRRVWDAAGRPGRFEIVEVGAGEGTFAAGLLSSLDGHFARAVTLRVVEPLPAMRARQRKRLERFGRVTWSPSLAEAPAAESGCLFANEVLDNLPVHLVEAHRGALRELWVEADGDLALVPGELSDPALDEHLRRLEVRLPEGHRLEVCLEAAAFVAAAARLVRRGAVVLVDYGMEVTELLERPLGTLAAYSREGADAAVLQRPGARDLTAHVNWSWVRLCLQESGLTAVGPRPQAAVLRELGLGRLDADARAAHDRAVGRGLGARAVRALSRRHALAALADAGGLGSLGVMVGLRGVGEDVVTERQRG